MAERTQPISDRLIRQIQIDEAYVDPIWSRHVDIPLLEICCACSMTKNPVILLPELRFRSLLQNLAQCLPGSGKLMIVDNTNVRFESLRQCTDSSGINKYFSTQEMSALNYAENSFNFALTELSLSSKCRAEVNFSVYRRVLKPGGYIIWSTPLTGSFPAFFDILEECLFTIDSKDAREIMESIDYAMNDHDFLESPAFEGYAYDGGENTEFVLNFPDIDTMLASTLVESHYLDYCLHLSYPKIHGKKLLTSLIRSFQQYFQGQPVQIPMKIGIHSAHKL